MTGVFHDFVFGDGRFDRDQVEYAAYKAKGSMTSEERRAANDALLAKLDSAKHAFPGLTHHYKDWLRDPYINTLVSDRRQVVRAGKDMNEPGSEPGEERKHDVGRSTPG